ncbi:MAG TPA: N-acetylglucosamine-6-phosphate deacetylase [Vicinamibacterales bacterium]|nr:N-acetylglucosamine-6-phosphate deacetylase [Vicinamibacterales bacterium]
MIVLAGGDVILPDRVLTQGAVLIDAGRIVAVETRPVDLVHATTIDATDCYVVPGFVDVHVHGVDGHDTLDGGDAVSEIARRLTRYGVTAFCPTTVACAAEDLRAFLQRVRQSRVDPVSGGARVLPAHLESNFINPDYRGAQPASCLRTPWVRVHDGDFSSQDVLDAIAASRPDVGIVTLAPELPGGIDLIRALVAAGHRVSLGHSGADFETAVAAIEAGARHATHLFNRMTAITHRAPGLAGAVLSREEVAAELICDGFHVHPAMCRVAIAAKGANGVMAITDGTAGSGLAVGSSTRLGGQTIHVRGDAAFLDDGTLAGSTLTMDRAFRTIVTKFGGSLVEAATMCSTTPARELGLTGFGVIAEGAVADLVVLDRGFRAVRTFIGGEEVWGQSGV